MDKMRKVFPVRVNGEAVRLGGGLLLTSLQALGVRLPFICWHPDIIDSGGRCRACSVVVDGKMKPACTTYVREGMIIDTKSELVRSLREAAMAVDPKFKSETRLGSAAEILALRPSSKEGTVHPRTRYVIRQPELCNHCNLCVQMCRGVQGVAAIGELRDGGTDAELSATEVKGFHGTPLPQTECVNCGQCINVCPTGALREASALDVVREAMRDPTRPKVIQFAPAVRVALAEEFGKAPGEQSLTREMVAAARLLGDNVHVFDTNFSADLTIIEEANELLERIRRSLTGEKRYGPDDIHEALPQITSCSPGWVTFVEKNFHDLLPNVSSCKSPMQMAGALTKQYWARKHGVDPNDVVSIAVMPCVAKKYEADRPEFSTDGIPHVDAVLTTREYAELLRTHDVDPTALDPTSKLAEFDRPFGIASGAGLIFGATGGVMEAALRTAYEVVTGRPVPFAKLDVQPVRGMQGVKAAAVKLENVSREWKFLEGVEVKVAVAHGLSNARKLCEEIRLANHHGLPPPYHFVEVMCCPGGCLGGGGQPKPTSMDIKKERAKLIYKEDRDLPLRKSHENPAIKELYRDFLHEPMGHASHELLHTTYSARRPEARVLLSQSSDAKFVKDDILHKRYPEGSRALLTNMFSDVVDVIGYVSEGAIAAIADHVGASPVNIESALSHYHYFPRSPETPDTTVYVCESIHCRQHGSDRVREQLERRGIKYHMTSWLGWCVDGAPAALVKRVGDSRIHHLANIQSPNDPRFDSLDTFENPLPDINFNVLSMRRFSPNAPSVIEDVMLSDADKNILASGTCPVSLKAYATDPEELIKDLDCSMLRGCGGAGFPTHIKWKAVRDQPPGRKCVVVNADEGLPSTFKDYYLLRNQSSRMRMLTGMAIAAHVVGAKECYIYLRYEYKNLKPLIEEDFRRYRTQLNAKVPDDLEFIVCLGGGPYVCGEETALFESLEGNLPQARTKREFPTVRGLFDVPTLVSNVETFAWIPSIVYHGGDEFHDLAMLPELGGAKLISLSGDVAVPTLAAIPMGMTLRAVLEESAGIPIEDIAAVEVGGLTEMLTYPSDFDLPLSLAFKPGHLSAGGSIVVFRKDNFDPKHIFRAKAKFYEIESCQLCAPCREGSKIFRNTVDTIMDDDARLNDDTLDTLHHVFHSMELLSNCGHGKACGKTARIMLDNKQKTQMSLP
ncbi:hypothetical protein CTAYLR_003007 [Chrysophaeum taylorii]|uniref:Uncharacterized protein n=1 Tax=Chrysophaeum taylorii TaxID=2483200 RepID=A0AAD7XHC7_9STRA|nr:hypothetical protein CTAYLR_003007 [Chrysophaeum taylorii]